MNIKLTDLPKSHVNRVMKVLTEAYPNPFHQDLEMNTLFNLGILVDDSTAESMLGIKDL